MAHMQTTKEILRCKKCECSFLEENYLYTTKVPLQRCNKVFPVYFEGITLCNICYSKLITDKI